MSDVRLGCEEVRALAAELALGTLEAAERGAALAHLDGCPTCRSHVDDLADAVDHVLAAAPEAEPPPGFEADVLARIAAERTQDDTGGRRRRVVRLVAAAAACVLAGVGIGLVARGAGDDGPGAEAYLASAPMVTPGGETIGEVWRSDGEDGAVLFVSVPAWSEVGPGSSAPSLQARLELEDGSTVPAGHVGSRAASGAWVATTTVDSEDIAAVSVVDADGRVWCTGRFD